MAGHSKWSNIKHRKAAQDAKRGKLNTRLIREITVAARSNSQVEDNPRLRLAVDKALKANLSKDVIERAIARSSAAQDEQTEEITYEGYGAGGVAVLVEAMTDNRNRTAAEVRHGFSKYNGNLGSDGSVSYLFDKKGVIIFNEASLSDDFMEKIFDFDIDDIENETESKEVIVTVSPQYFHQFITDIAKLDYGYDQAELMMIPQTTITCDESNQSVSQLLEHLSELQDVQNVYSNAVFEE